MKFLLQVRFNGADKVIGALPAEEQKKVTGEFEAIRQSPGVLDGNQLQAAGEGGDGPREGRDDAGDQRPRRRGGKRAGRVLRLRHVRPRRRRSRSRHGSRSPGSAGPSRCGRCWSASYGQVPGARRGNRPHALHRRLRRRPVAALLRRPARRRGAAGRGAVDRRPRQQLDHHQRRRAAHR